MEQSGVPKNIAGVDTATSTQTAGRSGTWVLTLKELPRVSNFTAGMALVYNSKGTHNPGSDNRLTVTQVMGPTKYKATGPYPINL